MSSSDISRQSEGRIGPYVQQLISNQKITNEEYSALNFDNQRNLEDQNVTRLIISDRISVQEFCSLTGEDQSDLKFAAQRLEMSNIDIRQYLAFQGPDRVDFLRETERATRVGGNVQQLINNNKITLPQYRALNEDDQVRLEDPDIVALIIADKISVTDFCLLSYEQKADLRAGAQRLIARNTNIHDFVNLRGPDREDFIRR